ncbi:MAG: membrane protein insertase YidC [Nitrospinae bacterium]|nr:membrane protein insertase YidC [Nitrospinota bacterium]MBI3814376.1 membrane protein insertase YidC [Nitrospinota bacterium]
MEKRAFLAVILSVLVFILYQYYYISRFEPGKVKPEHEKKAEKAAEPPVVKDMALRAEEVIKIREAAVKEREIKIDTRVTEVILTNRGGKIKAINLLKYKTKDGAPVNLVKDAEGKLLPVKLEFTDKNFSDAINSTLFDTAKIEDIVTLSPDRRSISVRFSYRDDSGFEIYKEYTFYHDEYKIDVSIKTDGGAASAGGFSYQALWGPGLKSDGGSDGYSYEGPTSYIGRELILDKLKGKGEQIYHEGNIKWVAMQNKYFMAALIPVEAKGFKAISKTSETGDVSVGLEYISVNGRAENRVILYAGPKESEILKSYNVSLEEIINYGWFDFLAKPLFKVLKLFYRFTHNYGIAIIILTVIIKLIFYPLSQKSLKSMQKLQRLQPELKIIQERHKNDRQKMSTELMRLYKENKVNPFGGFFLIIIQIPVFIALYKILMETIELRQSPFFGWIKDLSDKDPYYITPIIMGGTMLIQQKMTPSTGDPTQAKIMLIMPVIFTFMFLNFPSGLVLYWLVNNILSIAQQYAISKQMKK